jgi:hypothetical protein
MGRSVVPHGSPPDADVAVAVASHLSGALDWGVDSMVSASEEEEGVNDVLEVDEELGSIRYRRKGI